jgi:hypothetical protein
LSPKKSSGPKRMKMLARKRSGIWIPYSSMYGRKETIPSRISPGLTPRMVRSSSGIPRRTASQKRLRKRDRQYQTRRREMMSACCRSRPAPYSVARGIRRWATTSMKPRKAMTSTNVTSSAQMSGQSLTP